MISPLRWYISAFPRCTVTKSSCVAQRTNAPLGMLPLSAEMSPRRFTNITDLAHVPARLSRKPHKPECSMIQHILPKPRPLSLFSPRRSPPSCLGSFSSVRLHRCMRNHDVHCRKLEPQQNRHDIAGIRPCPSCRPGPGSEAPPPIGSCRQRRPGARRLPGYRGASGSSCEPATKVSTTSGEWRSRWHAQRRHKCAQAVRRKCRVIPHVVILDNSCAKPSLHLALTGNCARLPKWPWTRSLATTSTE